MKFDMWHMSHIAAFAKLFCHSEWGQRHVRHAHKLKDYEIIDLGDDGF